MRKAAARRRATFPAPICITCSAAGETLGGTLLSLINLYYYQDLMAGARAAIGAGRFADYVAETKEQWTAKRDVREEHLRRNQRRPQQTRDRGLLDALDAQTTSATLLTQRTSLERPVAILVPLPRQRRAFGTGRRARCQWSRGCTGMTQHN